MSQAVLELHFGKAETFELIKTVFKAPSLENPIVGIRGNHAPSGVVSFRWTKTTHAIAMFFLKAREIHFTSQLPAPALEGIKGDPVTSIVRLLHKRMEGWTIDLFGADIQGRPLLSKIILCCNYLGKRPGPMQVFLRTNYLSPQNIRVFLDSREITERHTEMQALTKSMEAAWKRGVRQDNVIPIKKSKNNDKVVVQRRKTIAVAA